MEPTPALAAAAAEMKWVVIPNLQSVHVLEWPHLTSEPKFCGEVHLLPRVDPPLPPRTVWTDGSVIVDRGGAAALQLDPHREVLQAVGAHGLPLLAAADPGIELSFDGGGSGQRGMREGAEVHFAVGGRPQPPWKLEKVKANDTKGLADCNFKTRGKDQANYLAKHAVAAGRGHDAPRDVDPRFEDAVRVRDEHGVWVRNVRRTSALKWWELRRG